LYGRDLVHALHRTGLQPLVQTPALQSVRSSESEERRSGKGSNEDGRMADQGGVEAAVETTVAAI